MRPGGFPGSHAFGPSCRFTPSTARSFKPSQVSALSRSGLSYLTFGRAGSGPTDRTYMPPLRSWTESLWQSVLPQCWQETRHEAPAMSSGPPPPRAGVVTCVDNSLQDKEFCELLLGSHASKRVVRCDKAN